MYKGRVLEALRVTEAKFGRPVYGIEIYQTLMKTSYLPVGPMVVVSVVLFALIAHDEILTNT